MTERETVREAIAHRETDAMPINIEVTSGFWKRLTAKYGDAGAADALGNHMLRKKYKRNVPIPGGELDLFGVTWGASKDGGDVGNVLRYPMSEDFEGYKFPAVNTGLAKSIVDELAREKRLYTMFSITMGFFERAWSLYGMENLLIDMLAEPARIEYIFEGIYAHHDALLDTVLGGDFDAVYFGDDWGQQKGMIMGPAMWRQYIKPYVSKLFDKIKRAGKQIVLHSCGDLREVMGEVVDMGVDVYNTVQPEIYDLKTLKREYGKSLTFYGGISTQQFLPYATAAEVRAETLRVLGTMAGGGGYILSPTHAVTEDIPVENILALAETGRGYKR